jgi:glycosyltransferase involved in cell wall biosynthesis
METSPKVSVLIPTFNSAPFLEEAIESVLNQTFKDFELIIVDNHSADNTDDVVIKYLSDPRVFYYKNDSNLGLAGNWNKCLTYAKGEYIKYLCSDDKIHPQLLEKFVPIMDQNSNISLITSYREEFGMETGKNEPPLTYMQNGKKIIYETLKDRNWIGEPSSVMFRKANLWLGNFSSDYIFYLDWDMWLKQLSIGDCYIIPEFLSYFRVHQKQVSKMVMKTFLNYYEVYHFYRAIRTEKKYKIDFTEFDIDSLIKRKAILCSNAIPKLLFRLNKKENLVLLKKILKIVYNEKVVFQSFIEWLKKIIKKVSGLFSIDRIVHYSTFFNKKFRIDHLSHILKK